MYFGGLLWCDRMHTKHNDEQLLDMCRIVKQLSSCCRNIRLVANLLDLNNKQKKKEKKKKNKEEDDVASECAKKLRRSFFCVRWIYDDGRIKCVWCE